MGYRWLIKRLVHAFDKVVFLALVLLAFWVGWNRTWFIGRFNWADDFIWGSRWDRVLVGQLPYRDFFELYGPGFLIFLAPLYKLLGEGLPAIRVIHYWLFPTVSLLVLFVLLGQLGLRGWRRALGMVIVAVSFLGMTWLSQPMRIWFGLGALLPIVLAIKKGSYKWAVLGGVTTVLVGLLSTEQGVAALAAGVAGIVGFKLLKLPKSLKQLKGYTFGVLLAAGIAALLMAQAGMLESYLNTAFKQIPMYQNAAYGFVFPGYDLVDHPLRVGWYLPFFAWALALVYWVRRAKQAGNDSILPFMLLIFSVFSLRVYTGRTEFSHFAVDNVPLWILLIATWFNWWRRRKTPQVEALSTAVVCLAATLATYMATATLSPYWRELFGRALRPQSLKSRLVYFPPARVWVFSEEAKTVGAVLDFVNQNVLSDEEVYPFAVVSGFSNLLGRVTPNYFEQAWFAQTAQEQQRLIYEIERRRVPWVIYSLRDDVIRLDQKGEDYILATYQPVFQSGEYLLMKRAKNWKEDELAQLLTGGNKLPGSLKGLRGLQDLEVLKKNGERWVITGERPEWEANLTNLTNLTNLSYLVVNYRLGFSPGLASFSKTALTIGWQGKDGVGGEIVYKEPFLLPNPQISAKSDLAEGWQEAWVKLPPIVSPTKLTLSLSWPGGLNPRASWVEWGEIRVK